MAPENKIEPCSPDCLGWDVFDCDDRPAEIQRCDDCDRFEDDEEATEAAMDWVRQRALRAKIIARLDRGACLECGEDWEAPGSAEACEQSGHEDI